MHQPIHRAMKTAVATATTLAALLLTAPMLPAHAAEPTLVTDSNPTATTAPAASAPAAETDNVFVKAFARAVQGPNAVPLKDQAKLNLPAGYRFVKQPEATQLMHAMGNPGEDDALLGLIFPVAEDANWFISVRFEAEGFIKDDDAKDWNADDLLNSYREGTEESNKDRAKLGIKGLTITGWAEKPAYDATTHRLAWAMIAKEEGAADDDLGVNYNTYALGRQGYFSLNLVTDLKDLPKDKTEAQKMLTALSFNDGKRYSDYNADTDHTAEYGLAALVVGAAAAKKTGLLAGLLLILAKFGKVIFVGLLGVGYAIKKLFFKGDK